MGSMGTDMIAGKPGKQQTASRTIRGCCELAATPVVRRSPCWAESVRPCLPWEWNRCPSAVAKCVPAAIMGHLRFSKVPPFAPKLLRVRRISQQNALRSFSTNVSLEVPDLSLELGNLSLELGNLRLELGNLRLELGNLRLELGNLSLELGNLSLELGNLSLELPNLSLELPKVSLELPKVSLRLPDLRRRR